MRKCLAKRWPFPLLFFWGGGGPLETAKGKRRDLRTGPYNTTVKYEEKSKNKHNQPVLRLPPKGRPREDMRMVRRHWSRNASMESVLIPSGPVQTATTFDLFVRLRDFYFFFFTLRQEPVSC